MEYVIGEQVINKKGEVGCIVSFDGKYIAVDFSDRTTSFLPDAFEKGFLSYLDTDLQRQAEESIAQTNAEAARRLEARRIAETTAKAEASKKPKPSATAIIESSTVRLDAAPVTMSAVKKKDTALAQAIFSECDKDTPNLYALFQPKMAYLRFTSQARSRYCVGFLTQYLDTYVFRVFSREDIYKKRMRSGVTVMKSDTTEILRVLYINDHPYYFTKNISTAMNSLTHTVAYSNWHCSTMAHAILLNEVVRRCDCGYLNDHLAAKDVNCLQYLRLLFSALHNNKVEIVFKNKLFLSTFRIADLAGYLEEFSPKQIDFASKHDVINALPMIKRHGLYEVDVLTKLEMLMQKRRWQDSVYCQLHSIFERLQFDLSELDRKLILFLRRNDDFNASIYGDYINDLRTLPGVTIDDFFDNHYMERHAILSREKGIQHDQEQAEKYAQAAKELSWIDREDGEYSIIIPKKIEDFRLEGDVQHNCVYSAQYYRKVIRKQSIIVFLRKRKNVPFVTIEYDYETFSVLQALGKYNTRIDPGLHEYIVKLGNQLRCEMLSQN